MIRYLVEHPLHYRFMDQFHASPILTPATNAEGLRAFEPYVGILIKGQREGIIKSLSIEELMQFVNGGLMAFVRWVLHTKRELTQTLIDNQLRIAWDAIKE
jgi:hypothetical protein